MTKHLLYILALILTLAACTSSPHDARQTDEAAPMYPDYADVTIPVNIAPLNFLLRDDVSRVCVYINNV